MLPAPGGVPSWWPEAIGYEIYIRSFADSSGDGVGDLDGVTGGLDYLAWLGVTVIWVTPFYPSPGHDAGYDVADYVDVDPMFGDLAAFDRLVTRAHELGLRVVIDLVPNHSSSEHPWFIASRSDRRNPQRDWYVWRDGKADGEPPNNWVSVFGGPAWTFDEHTGQWWMHRFLPEQPDLNWSEPAVRKAFDGILGFWAERGIDGVRIDVAHGLEKHPDLLDLPPALRAPTRRVGMASGYASLEHIHDIDQDAVLDVYRRWRRSAFTEDERLLLGEVYLRDPERFARYVRDDDGLHASFWFPLQETRWEAARLRGAIEDGLRAGTVNGQPGVGVAWASDSHDQDRTASRFGGGLAGRRRALALMAVIMGLPGVPFLYQGQELCLTDGRVPPDRVRDPIAVRLAEVERGRDPARTPMPWKPGRGMGFCPAGVEPWLPFGGREDTDTVALQRSDPRSWLHAVRGLIALRWRYPELRSSGASYEPLRWLPTASEVLAYRRGEVVVAANCGSEPHLVQLPAVLAADQPSPTSTWDVVWSTPGTDPHPDNAVLFLEPDCAAVLHRMAAARV